MLKKIRREPAVVRSAIVGVLALVAIVVPGIDVDAVEGIVGAVLSLALGINIRGVVTPVKKG